MHYRQQTHFPQTLLAGWMRISVPTYKRTESGARQASLDEITAFAHHAKLPVALLTDEKQALPDPLPFVPPIARLVWAKPRKKAEPSATNQALLTRLHTYLTSLPESAHNQRQLAERLQMDEGLLSRYLSGQRLFSEKLILRVSAKLSISADWLRSGLGTPNQSLVGVEEMGHDGKRLENYLFTNGLSYRSLHEASDNRAYKTTRLYGKRINIRHQTRQKIARALGVSVRDIWGC